MLALAAAVSACSPAYVDLPAAAYRHLGDRLKVYFRPLLGRPCQAWSYRQKHAAVSAERCFRFNSARRTTGTLLISDYGDDVFIAGRVTRTDTEFSRPTSVAVSTRYDLSSLPPMKSSPLRRAYAITFIGRETERSARRYARSVIIIDRVERVRRVSFNER